MTLGSLKAGKEVLGPFPADQMKIWPISSRVNSPRNNDPDLIHAAGNGSGSEQSPTDMARRSEPSGDLFLN
jgi:hypothetical protein